MVIRDYKKGKSLMESDTSKFLRTDPKRDKESSLLPNSYKTVFAKVWLEVEQITSDFREELFKQLGTMSNPIETQEKIIGYLIDLDAKKDPLSCYLEDQYAYLLSKLAETYQKHILIINGYCFLLRFAICAENIKSRHILQ